MSDGLERAEKDPAVRNKMSALGMELNGKPGEALRNLIQVQRAQWKPVVEASGFTASD